MGTSRRGSTNGQERWLPPEKRLAPILTLVGWSTSTFTTNQSHFVKKEGMRSSVRARIMAPLSFRASIGPSGGDAGSSEREIRASTATIRRQIPGTEGKRRRRQCGRTQETHGWCSHGTERFRVGRRRRERDKVEALPNRPRATTNRGAGSVSWRGQLWRTNELGFQRMMRSLYGHGWRRFLNQEMWVLVPPPSITCEIV